MSKKKTKLTAAELEGYCGKLKGKTPRQLVALYKATADEEKRYAIFRELLGRAEVVNVVETLKAKEV